MSIVTVEDSLFESWKTGRPGFVEDGVVSEQDYLSSSPTVAFILKEVNDPGGGGWDLREFLRNGGHHRTWNNVTRWVHGIHNHDQGDGWHQYEKITPEFRIEVLRSICAINLKKTPGKGRTKVAELVVSAKDDEARIREQYAIYDPDITICGGTGGLFKGVVGHENLDWRTTDCGIKFYERSPKKFVISYYHPAVMKEKKGMHYRLMEAVNEILGCPSM